MKIEGNVICADEGMILRRKSTQEFLGTSYGCGYIYYLNGKKLDEPILDGPEDFEEVPEDVQTAWEKRESEKRYPSLVESYIRLRYTSSDEFSIQRQRDVKPKDFEEYFNYCEECKVKARHDLGLNNLEG